jgi:SAM-dependent methyltransferase
MKLRKMSLAESADRHRLYQDAVQDVVSEIDFIFDTWQQLRDRPAQWLREDFCGTANTSCEWVRRSLKHYVVGVDLDPEVLAWGRANNLGALGRDERGRIELLHADVLDAVVEPMDIVLAMNFSYYLFMERATMLRYFQAARQCLAPDGIMFLDAYGGYESPMVITEDRDCGEFTYQWEQASFNPIDASMDCLIHFEFPDGSRLDRAFAYRWRLWTLPEIRELLVEAGFGKVVVYWEGTDSKSGEGNGIYTPSEVGDPDPGWVCYIVAEK